VLDGVLEVGLSMDILETIATKYARLGLVPTHYLFSELFAKS